MRILLLFLFMTTVAFSQDQDEAARMAAGCGANSVQFEVKTEKKQHPMAQLETDKAVVYVFRDEEIDNVAFTIGSVTTRVGIDGNWVGANGTKSYFYATVEPGDHRLCTQRQSRMKSQLKVSAAISFTAESGKAYYFRTRTPIRESKGEIVKLVPIDPAQAQLLIPQFAYSTFTIKKEAAAKRD